MDALSKSIRVIQLYDVYQELLTKKQKDYFEAYYFDDLSISEISENKDVSRNAVHDQIKRTVLKLEDLENKLQLVQTKVYRNKLLDSVHDDMSEKELIDIIQELKKVEWYNGFWQLIKSHANGFA